MSDSEAKSFRDVTRGTKPARDKLRSYPTLGPGPKLWLLDCKQPNTGDWVLQSGAQFTISAAFSYWRLKPPLQDSFVEVKFRSSVRNGETLQVVTKRLWRTHDEYLFSLIQKYSKDGNFTRRVFIARHYAGSFGRWAQMMNQDLCSLIIQGFGGRNLQPCDNCQKQWEENKNEKNEPIMAPYFGCVSLPGEFQGVCANCFFNGTQRSCCFVNSIHRAKEGYNDNSYWSNSPTKPRQGRSWPREIPMNVAIAGLMDALTHQSLEDLVNEQSLTLQIPQDQHRERVSSAFDFLPPHKTLESILADDGPK